MYTYHPGRFRVCIQNYRPAVGEEKHNMSACKAYVVHLSRAILVSQT